MLSVHEVLQRRYRIVRLIGKGSIGAVYEAVDESFSEPVAIKEVRYELTDSIDEDQLDHLRDAFKRQAKSLAKARHPAVPYVRDYFLDREGQYLVADLVEGDDLGRQLSDRGKPFPLDDVLAWTEQLLDALDHLHNLDPPVIHGNIKPKNLKLTPTGQLKLLDLGIEKTADHAAFSARSSDSDFTDLNCLSIEQIVNIIDPTFREFILDRHRYAADRVLKQNRDARSDLYMVGATIYYLLTNRPATDIVKRTIQTWEGDPDPLPSLSDLNKHIPLTISDFVLKALAIDQDDRFDTASEMRTALKYATERGLKKAHGKSLAAIAAVANWSLNGKSPLTEKPTTPDPTELLVDKGGRSSMTAKLSPSPPSPAISSPETHEGLDVSQLSAFETEGLDSSQDTEKQSGAGVQSVGLPRYGFYRPLMAGAAILSLVGVGALIWLLNIGRSPTEVIVEAPAIEQTETLPAVGSSTDESTAIESPPPQSETDQPALVQDDGPAAATGDISSELRDDKQTRDVQQARSQKHSAEPNRRLKPDAANNSSTIKPTQEKKKITIDDLIHDN